MCDFNEAYIVVTGKGTATNPGNNNDEYNRKVVLKISAPFFNCTLKINNQLIEDAQDFGIIIQKNQILDMNDDDARNRIFYTIRDSESFDYKSKLVDILGDNLPTVPATATIEICCTLNLHLKFEQLYF